MAIVAVSNVRLNCYQVMRDGDRCAYQPEMSVHFTANKWIEETS